MSELIVDVFGTQTWYTDGKIHRVDKDPSAPHLTLPAVIYANGDKSWWKDGKCHRGDKDPVTGLTLPSVICANGGTMQWYKDGKCHRDDKDPVTGLTLPAVIWANGGTMRWYKDGKCHRDDKDPGNGLTLPAVIWADGEKLWYKDGNRHRDDKDPVTGLTLPAVISNRGVSMQWFIDGRKISRPTCVYTRVLLQKYSECNSAGVCYNNGVSYITHEELKDIDYTDILLLPVQSLSDGVDNIKYHCYTREEVELWWENKPMRTHPTTRVPLTDMEKNMIVTFMDDDTFFDEKHDSDSD